MHYGDKYGQASGQRKQEMSLISCVRTKAVASEFFSGTLHHCLEVWALSVLASLRGTYFHHLPGLLGATGLR